MKKLIIYIFLIAAGAAIYSSCTSPTDVPANRRWETDKPVDGVEDKIISINTQELIFYDVAFGSYQTKDFIIMNNTNKPVTIDTIIFKNHSDKFNVWSPAFPFTLSPKNKEGYSERVFINFEAKKINEIKDTAYFNDFKTPFLKLQAIVPTVDINDVDFGNIFVGSSITKPITIINNGNTAITVEPRIKLIDQANVFDFLSELPVTVEAKSEVIRLIRFSPKEDKQYTGRIEFEINASGFVDNVAELRGLGIKK